MWPFNQLLCWHLLNSQGWWCLDTLQFDQLSFLFELNNFVLPVIVHWASWLQPIIAKDCIIHIEVNDSHIYLESVSLDPPSEVRHRLGTKKNWAISNFDFGRGCFLRCDPALRRNEELTKLAELPESINVNMVFFWPVPSAWLSLLAWLEMAFYGNVTELLSKSIFLF